MIVSCTLVYKQDMIKCIYLIIEYEITENVNIYMHILTCSTDLFVFCRNEFPQAQALPAGHVPLARLLRLTPEDRPFPTPVQAGRGGPKIVNHTKVQGSAFPLSGIVPLRKLLKEQPNLVLLARRHVNSKLCSNYC